MVRRSTIIRSAATGLAGAALVIAVSGAAAAAPVLAADQPAPTAMAACTPDDGHASITVQAPTQGQVVTGDSLAITVKAHGYRLDAGYAGSPVRESVGHYHEILDGRLVDMTPLTDPRHDTISMVGVTPGAHTLTIVPACNDHSMMMSKAVDVAFTYAGPYLPMPTAAPSTGAPAISITGPAAGSTVRAGSTFDMTAAVSNFTLCGDCFGKANVDGVGHWHIFIDAPVMSNMRTMAGDLTQTVSLKGVAPGWHTFWAVLVDNSHMPLMNDPAGMAAVYLYVAPAR